VRKDYTRLQWKVTDNFTTGTVEEKCMIILGLTFLDPQVLV